MFRVKTMSDKYNLNITISLDSVPREYGYNLILLDRYSRLLSVGKPDGTGEKSITIPCWCLKDESYTLRVQTLEGNSVISEESYKLSFGENTLPPEYMWMREKINFGHVVRRKLWESQEKSFGEEVSVFRKGKYEEKYLRQMDGDYCEGQEFYA